MNGVFDLADLEFMKKLVLYTYVKTVSVEELLEVFNHGAFSLFFPPLRSSFPKKQRYILQTISKSLT